MKAIEVYFIDFFIRWTEQHRFRKLRLCLSNDHLQHNRIFRTTTHTKNDDGEKHVRIWRIWNPISLHIKLGHFQADSFSHRRNAVWRWRDALDCSILQWRRNKNNTQQATNLLTGGLLVQLLLLLLALVNSCRQHGTLKAVTCMLKWCNFLIFLLLQKKISCQTK